jgi:gliding motility-associated-like protein
MVDASSGGGLSYMWHFGDNSISADSGSVAHTYNDSGVINAQLVLTDSVGCKDSTTQPVYVLYYSISSFHDTTLCLTEPLELINAVSVNLPGDYWYIHFWSPSTDLNSDTAWIPSFKGFGNYQYVLTETLKPYGCIAHDTINVHSVLGEKVLNMTANTTIMLGGSVQLNADNEILYFWKPDDGTLNNPNISNPVATPTVTTTYVVYGTDVFGCLDSASVTIRIDSTVHEFFPSGFSPNGDGLNDVFKPIGLTYQNFVEMRVFNRWGEEVFYSNNKDLGWDGTYKGVPQDIGTYYYVMILQLPGQPTTTAYRGDVTLIR